MHKYSARVSKTQQSYSSRHEFKIRLEEIFFCNMASRDLEKEFDPTQWSSRIKDSKELLESHVEFGNTGKSLILKEII